MNCPDLICRLVTCPVTDDLPAYLGQYSLQTGFQFANLTFSVPTGGGFYIVPAGTIIINLPTNPTFVSYMGCQSMVTQSIPPGSTPAQILAIVNSVMGQVGNQLSQCNAPKNYGNPFLPGSFTSGPGFVGCGGGQQLQQIGGLPSGVSFSTYGLTLVGGIFSSSISQADADSKSQAYLLTFFGVSVTCGWWNTQQQAMCCDGTTQTVAATTIFSLVSQADADAQALAQATAACPTCYWNVDTNYTCPDMSVQNVPAHTYMSIISQADADAQALAAAIAKCPAADCSAALVGLVWTPTLGGGPIQNFSVTGNKLFIDCTGGFVASSVTLTTTIVNGNATDCHYTFQNWGSPPLNPSAADGSGSASQVFENGSLRTDASTPYTALTFTVPAMSSLSVSFRCIGGTLGGHAGGRVEVVKV